MFPYLLSFGGKLNLPSVERNGILLESDFVFCDEFIQAMAEDLERQVVKKTLPQFLFGYSPLKRIFLMEIADLRQDLLFQRFYHVRQDQDGRGRGYHYHFPGLSKVRADPDEIRAGKAKQ